jgi:hypothetical protein
VDKHVSLQVLLFFKVFAAPLLWTLVGLHAVDRRHMNLPLFLLIKLHIANRAYFFNLLSEVLNEVLELVVVTLLVDGF